MSRYPKVRLYLNDKLVGEKPAGEANDCKAVFTLPYTPGELKGVGVDESGQELETVMLSTTGRPTAIRLTPDKTTFTADGQDLVYVIAEAVDADGRVVPDAEVPVSFSANGSASVKASGSANLTTTDSYCSPDTKTWKGRAMVILKADKKKGGATLKATSSGLKGATLKLQGK